MAQYFCSHIIHKSPVQHHSPLREPGVPQVPLLLGQEGLRHTSLERTVQVPGVLSQERMVRVPGTPGLQGCVAL